MNIDRWQQVKSLFNAALDQPETERETYLKRATGQDTALLEEVLSLLQHALPGTTIFEELKVAAADSWLHTETKPLTPGDLLGEYRIGQELGQGGMAVVYGATREGEGFEQQVALKVMKRGIDTAAVVARFQRERRLLASLQHPAIARMYDGGSTPEGLPYFVMERCDGMPVTQFAKGKSPDHIVQTCLRICEAVAYAHRRLIIHRDLKPANILVNDAGEVKLLDFGIARLVTDESDLITHAGQRWLTPAYASPEQLREETLTTASDVYQLGLILLEMLTGTRSFSSDKKREATNLPQIPATLDSDLRAILHKSLHPSPDQRYASADQLAQDLSRFLSGDPVEAKEPALGYRLGKLIAKNKVSFAAAAAVLLAIVIASGVSIRQATIARTERDKAETTLSWLEQMFLSPDPMSVGLGDPDITVKAFLDQSLPTLAVELADQPDILARIWESAGNMYAGLSQFDSASALMSRAASTYPETHPGKLRAMLRLAQYNLHAQESDSMYASCLDYWETHPGEEVRKGEIWKNWGRELVSRGELSKGDSLLSLAVRDLEANHEQHEEMYIGAIHGKAMALREQGQYKQADSIFAQVMTLAEAFYPTNHPYLANVLNSRGINARYMQRFDSAKTMLQLAVAIQEKMLPAGHPETLSSMHNLALVESDAGNPGGAEAMYKQILAAKAIRYGDDSYQYANTLQNLGLTLMNLEKYEEAEDSLTKTFLIFKNLLGNSNPRVYYPLLTLTNLKHTQADYSAAERYASQALEGIKLILPDSHPLITDANLFLARAWVGQRRYQKAEPLLLDCIKRYQAPGAPNAYNVVMAEEALAKLRENK
ncbi:MAG: serine/threonine-protein kinase [Bacteroidia bacterium]|nr:serine/threonine-protein kinase [Bacteroidia bacterium]